MTAINTAAIQAAMLTAKSKGIKFPKLRVGNFIFSLAPETGKNAGSIYVKSKTSIYLGKITTGIFHPYLCATALIRELEAITANLSDSLVAHGRKTGECSCCGRLLVEAVSVASGIGPICAENFGLAALREQLAIENGCTKNLPPDTSILDAIL